MEHLGWPLDGPTARFAASLCTPSPSTIALSEHASLVSDSSCAGGSRKRLLEVVGSGLPSKRTRDSRGAGAPETSLASDSGRESSPVKSHTRRCREKVNEKFARLLEALPVPPSGVEVKHKAQVLEYTIRVFRALLAKRDALRMDIALASPTALARWGAARSLHCFASLYARKHGWPYAETWRHSASTHGFNLEATHVEPNASQLRALGPLARGVGGGVVTRVAASRRCEWLPLLGNTPDPVALVRADAAGAVGVQLVFAVPVIVAETIREKRPEVAGVLLFMDTARREYSTRTVEQAAEWASIVADAQARHANSQHGTVL